MKVWDNVAQKFYESVKASVDGLQIGGYISSKTRDEILDFIQEAIEINQKEGKQESWRMSGEGYE